MRPIVLFLFLGIVLSSACSKKDDESTDNFQTSQAIITQDSSAITGQLTIDVYYLDAENGQEKEAYNADVYLYASYNDVVTDSTNHTHDLSLFHLTTSSSSNEAYFGYINHGNYYVWASAEIHRIDYEQVSVVQVRPRQDEYFDIKMTKK